MTTFSALDCQMMAYAIQLAERGKYTTSPNPNVGCVIVSPDGEIVGRGYHHRAGEAHAEVFALEQAGDKAKGATAYVTLEPCSHHGRTGPCAEALVRAQVAKVFIAMVDPNPLVAGKGLALLASHGIEVAKGLLESRAEALNLGFLRRMRTGLPWVTVKMAASLDGKIALNNGVSQWVTGTAARRDVQRHRAQSCAILTGSGTVLSDNPSMNVRYDELGNIREWVSQEQLRQPIRIVLDGRNQLGAEHKMFALPGRLLVFNQHHNGKLPEHIEQQQVVSVGNKLDLKHVLRNIAQLGVNNLWVEAGGRLAGALLENSLVDELILYQAPKLLGDKGQDIFVMSEKTTMNQAELLQWQDIRQIGDDIKLTARLTR